MKAFSRALFGLAIALGLTLAARAASFSQPLAPSSANVLDGFVSCTASCGPSTLVTIPAGRTWVGQVSEEAVCTNAAAVTAACAAEVEITTAGTGVVPAAAQYVNCEVEAGANAASGLVGTQNAKACAATTFVVVAPVGNSVTIQAQVVAVAGTFEKGTASAIGVLQ